MRVLAVGVLSCVSAAAGRGVSTRHVSKHASSPETPPPHRAHARDELGIDLEELANPLQAAVVSALSFTSGAGMPLLAAVFIRDRALRNVIVAAVSTAALLLFGFMGAWLGGASLWRGMGRVLVGGWLALAITYGVGTIFDAPA